MPRTFLGNLREWKSVLKMQVIYPENMKKLLATIFAIGTLFAVVPYALGVTKQFTVNTLSGGSLTTSLVSYWPMTGNSNDYYGSNNSTDTAMSYGLSYGKVGQGANFNGTSSFLNYGKPVGLSNPTSSVNFWVDALSLPNANNGTYYVGQTYAGSEVLIKSNGTLYASATGVPNHVVSYNGGTHTLATSTWYMITWTYDSANGLHVYVNGASDGSAAANGQLLTSYGSGWVFGEDGGTEGRLLTGYMDEIGVWSKILSANEISDLYNAGVGQTMCTVGTDCATTSSPKHKVLIISFDALPKGRTTIQTT